MGQLILAAIIALIFQGIFSNASDSSIKKVARKILLAIIAGLSVIPIVLWCFTTFSPFILIVLLLFVVFRWLLGSSAQRMP